MTRPTTSSSRLFIAVLVPATLREEIMNMISELRDVSGDDVRWINEQNLHITLKFFGEIKFTPGLLILLALIIIANIFFL